MDGAGPAPNPESRVEFELRTDDIRAIVDWLAEDSAESRRWVRQARRLRLKTAPVGAALCGLAAVGAFSLIRNGTGANDAGLVVGACVAIAFLVSIFGRGSVAKSYRQIALRQFDQGAHDVVTGPCSVALRPDGVEYRTPLYRTLSSWNAVRSVKTTGSAIVIGVRERRSIVIPATAFEQPSAFHEFASRARDLLSAGGGGDVELLRRFLADHDMACPECGYNLRGGLGVSCPECHAPLDWMSLKEAVKSGGPRAA